MLIRNLKVSGLLSFGPKGIDLPLKPLNVLIGPNGSGKSNLLEVLALLRSAPTNLPAPVKEMGGVREWLWKGRQPASEARLDVTVDYPQRRALRHVLAIGDHGGRFEVLDERIEYERPNQGKSEPYFFYRFQQGNPVLNESDDEIGRRLKRENVLPEQSILSQVRDPERCGHPSARS